MKLCCKYSRSLAKIPTEMAVVVDGLREFEFLIVIKLCSTCSLVLVECPLLSRYVGGGSLSSKWRC